MEGKTVILSVLLISLVMGPIQVFRVVTRSREDCTSPSGCKIISGSKSPHGYLHDILENSGDAVNEYCILGCTSYVCGAMTTLENYDASEIVDGAVERSTKACSTFCTNGSKAALETA